MNSKCPCCGAEIVCDNCKATEPFFIFMPQLHSITTDGLEVALADNVQLYMPNVWAQVSAAGAGVSTIIGASVYKYTDTKTAKAPSGRVVRMPLQIAEMWRKSGGDYFKEPPNYRERRDSDRKSMKGHLAGKRLQPHAVSN